MLQLVIKIKHKNKLLKLILSSSTTMIILFMIILIPCLMVMDFFGANITDGYVENNSEYSYQYKEVLNSNINLGNGYVSLERILYFYLLNDKLTFGEIYSDNLDNETKKQKPISEVCDQEKYKYLSVCSTTEIENSNQINEEQKKPFSSPLNISNLNITSFFMEQRVVFGEYDIHTGWDFSSPNNTPVFSVCDGTVEKVDFRQKDNTTDISGGGGNQITIKCEVDELSYYVIYAHLYPNSSKIKQGSKVNSGDQIAEVGTTGYSTGPHLHFQVKLNDTNVDGLGLIDFTNQNNTQSNPYYPNEPLLPELQY